VSNRLIVESENDKFFIEALVKNINITIEVDEPVCSIDEYNCLGGMSKLENKLVELKGQALKHGINKIGIIFDADDVGIETRTKQVQEKIDLVFEQEHDIQFKIHILNINGSGELETLLKQIKSKDSIIADCLDNWRNCLPDEKTIKEKDFDKFWIQVYQRYDCCTNREKKQADKNCNNEASLIGKEIYDFNKDIKELNSLKKFLMSMNNS